jgi:hypothetical protein
MESTEGSKIGVDHADTDHVSAWLRMLAIGLLVIFVVFTALDWCNLLPPLPAAVVAGTA